MSPYPKSSWVVEGIPPIPVASMTYPAGTRMNTDQSRIDDLIARLSETLTVEVKRWISIDEPNGISTIIRGALALRNRNGGYFVIGFDDKILLLRRRDVRFGQVITDAKVPLKAVRPVGNPLPSQVVHGRRSHTMAGLVLRLSIERHERQFYAGKSSCSSRRGPHVLSRNVRSPRNRSDRRAASPLVDYRAIAVRYPSYPSVVRGPSVGCHSRAYPLGALPARNPATIHIRRYRRARSCCEMR